MKSLDPGTIQGRQRLAMILSFLGMVFSLSQHFPDVFLIGFAVFLISFPAALNPSPAGEKT